VQAVGAGLLHHGQCLLGFRAGHDLRLGDAGPPAALAVLDPLLWQVEPAIDRDVPFAAAERGEHARLTVLQLAKPAAPLARYPDGVLALPRVKPKDKP